MAVVAALGGCSEHGSTPVDALDAFRHPPALVATPAMIDFGDLSVSLRSPPSFIEVVNVGERSTGDLVIHLWSEDFGLDPDTTTCHVPLPPGARCTLAPRFDPASIGTKSTMLTLTDGPASVTVGFAGVGLADPPVRIEPSSHDFGAVEYLTSSAPFTFTVTNDHGHSVGPLSFTVDGMHSSEFLLGGGGSCTNTSMSLVFLGAGKSCSLVVRFRPASSVSGPRTASLNVQELEADTSTVSVSGTVP